jgi:hypothetical protein
MSLGRRGDGGFRRRRVCNIADNRDATDLGGDAFGKLGVEVAHGNPGTLRCKPACGGGAQSRCATGHDGGLIFQLHGFLPCSLGEMAVDQPSVITWAAGVGE